MMSADWTRATADVKNCSLSMSDSAGKMSREAMDEMGLYVGWVGCTRGALFEITVGTPGLRIPRKDASSTN